MQQPNPVIEKQKLPKGMTYSLKSSFLFGALADAGIGFHVHLLYAGYGWLFDAHFWPSNHRVPYERLYLRAGAIPSSQAKAAREFLENTVIPQFIQWALAIARLPTNSPIRREQQLFFRDLASLAAR